MNEAQKQERTEEKEFSLSLGANHINASNSKLGYVFQSTKNYENTPIKYGKPSMAPLKELTQGMQELNNRFETLKANAASYNADYIEKELQDITTLAKSRHELALEHFKFDIDEVKKRNIKGYTQPTGFEIDRDNQARMLNITVAQSFLNTNDYETIFALADENISNSDIRALVKSKVVECKNAALASEKAQWIQLEHAIKRYEDELHFASDLGQLEQLEQGIKFAIGHAFNSNAPMYLLNAADVAAGQLPKWAKFDRNALRS